MKYNLTPEEEKRFWGQVESDLTQKPFNEAPSIWNRSAVELLQEKMHKKFLELYIDDIEVNCLLEIEDYKKSPLLDYQMSSTILSIFNYKTFRTTQDRTKNRFTLYIKNLSADEYIEENSIIVNLDDRSTFLSECNKPRSLKFLKINDKKSKGASGKYNELEHEISNQDNTESIQQEKIRERYSAFLERIDKNTNIKDICNFFEKHPSLLPGLNGSQGNLTHGAHKGLIFPEYKLEGTKNGICPDFLFVATNSIEATVVFIKLENPVTEIFLENEKFSKDFTQAFTDIQTWHEWIEEDENKSILVSELVEAYNSVRIKKLNIKCEFYLVMGRRWQYLNKSKRQQKLSLLSQYPYVVMSYDRLEPYSTGSWYMSVRKTENQEYKASYLSELYEYNQPKSIIHGHINKIDAIKNQEFLSAKEKTELLNEVKYWDSFDDPIKSIMAGINRKHKK